MIEHVHLRNFRRFRNQRFSLTSRAVLAGPNNSGKTTLLQAIHAWQQARTKWVAANEGKAHGVWPEVPIARLEFLALPVRDLRMLWSDNIVSTSGTGGKKDAPRMMSISVKGRTIASGKRWTVAMEFRHANADLMYVRPSDSSDPFAVEDTVTYIPPFSGIEVDEKTYSREYQGWLVGQAKPGDLIRNMLLDIHETPGQWKILNDDIREMFDCELLPPNVVGRPFVMSEYVQDVSGRGGRKRTRLDLACSGSGFLQVLGLLAFIHTRSAGIFLLDAPDAHLHAWLQNAIYDRMDRLARRSGSQVVFATHSGTLIDRADPEGVVSFYGRPHLLKSARERDQAREATKRLSNTDVLMADNGRVLYVEGRSDHEFLRAWANILGHPIRRWLSDRRNLFVVELGGRRVKETREHFFALAAANPDIKGFMVVDKNTHARKPESRSDRLAVGMWGRYEIESYLLIRDVIERFARRHAPRLAEAMVSAFMRVTPPSVVDEPLKNWPYFDTMPVSKHVLPAVFTDALVRRADYYRIAEVMTPEEIHPDIKRMLDRMAEHLGVTGP